MQTPSTRRANSPSVVRWLICSPAAENSRCVSIYSTRKLNPCGSLTRKANARQLNCRNSACCQRANTPATRLHSMLFANPSAIVSWLIPAMSPSTRICDRIYTRRGWSSTCRYSLKPRRVCSITCQRNHLLSPSTALKKLRLISGHPPLSAGNSAATILNDRYWTHQNCISTPRTSNSS